MPIYETTFVIDSLQKSEDMEATVTKIQTFIKNNGGEIKSIDEWGKRRLAYEINRKQYGNYYQIYFEGLSSLPGLLEREFRLDESILRYLTVIADPKALESKVEQDEQKEKTQSSAAVDTEKHAPETADEDNNEAELEEKETTTASNN